jgi:hypothetical protein
MLQMSYITKLFNTPFFQNKFVLYGSLLLVLLSILRHLANNNINAVVLIALIGLVMSYFSKNMIIVLLTAFAAVFLLETVGYRGVMEGMKAEKGKDADADAKEEDADADADKDAKEDKVGAVKDKPADKPKPEQTGVSNSKKITKTKNKQGMATLSPASYDGKDHDADEGEGAKGSSSSSNRIDYASTLEQAYDNIETIIGEDGVRGLTDQTKSLMNQQKELMENMKEMGPLLKSAEGFMEQLTGNGGVGGITSMLQGLVRPSSDKKSK